MSADERLTIKQKLGGWIVEMSWAVDEIQGGPSELVISSADPDNVPQGGLSSTVLRGIGFATAAASIRAEAAVRADLQPQRAPQVAMPLLQTMLDTSGITDEYLALLATEYLARVNNGEQKPVDHIAQELGKSPGTIKGHLWQARNRELLKGGSAGRKGGYITAEAVQIATDYLDDFFSALASSEDPAAET